MGLVAAASDKCLAVYPYFCVVVDDNDDGGLYLRGRSHGCMNAYRHGYQDLQD